MSQHKRAAAHFFLCILIVSVAMMVTGCAMPGKVSVGFFWDGDAANIPSFTCTDINNIGKGTYYLTLPGTYGLTYNFTAQPTFSAALKLEANETLLGQENVYYNVYLREISPPIIEQYP